MFFLEERDSSYGRREKIARGVYPREAAARLASIVIFLVLLSTSYVMWLAYALSVYLRPARSPDLTPALMRPEIILDVTILGILSSVVFFAIVGYVMGPKLSLHGRKLVPVRTCDYPLFGLVQSCSEKARLKRTPKISIDETSGSSLFVTGYSSRNAQIVISQDLVSTLSEDELNATICHELAHIKNGDMALMTWATTFQRSLKYWLALYFGAIIVGTTLVYGSIHNTIQWLLFSGQAPLADCSLGIMAPMFFVFVTIAVNSAARIRELSADDFASDCTNPSTLMSSIKSVALQSIASCMINGKAKILKIPRFWKTSRVGYSLQSHHPNLHERFARLRERKEQLKRLPFPTYWTAAYSGLVAALVMIGAKAFVFGTPLITYYDGNKSISYNIWMELLGRNVFYLWLLPAQIIFIVLNTLFLWNYARETFWGKEKANQLLRLGVTSVYMIKNIVVAATCYVVFSLGYNLTSVLGDIFTERRADLILGDQMSNFVVHTNEAFQAGVLCFLVFLLYLLAGPSDSKHAK